MTQAPTPGPLSVGDRVVAIADLRQTPNGSVWIKKGEEAVIVGELGVNNCLAIVLASNGNEGTWAKTCFRLAPTAPVQASGSEREHGPKCWGKTSFSDEMLYCYCGSTDSPPGETRESVARLAKDVATVKSFSANIATFYDGPDKRYIRDVAADIETVLALLSARPLALGGQHSGGEVEQKLERLQAAFPKAVENGVGRGMALAAAMVAPSDPVIAEQILHEAALTTKAALRALGVMEYDIKKLKPVLRNIAERKSA